MVSLNLAYLGSSSQPGLWEKEVGESSPLSDSSGSSSPACKSASSGDDAVESPSPPPRPLRTQGGPILYSVDSDGKKHEKPPQSYISLISTAILKAPGKKLLLGDIYQYVMDNFPYYQHVADKAWRNSIRHNLSLNECFIKSGRADNGKGNYWAIHPACVEDFSKGDYRRRQARRRARRSTMGVSQLPLSHRYNLGYVPMTTMPTGMGVSHRHHPYATSRYSCLPPNVNIAAHPAASAYSPPSNYSYPSPAGYHGYLSGSVSSSPYSAAVATSPYAGAVSPNPYTALMTGVSRYHMSQMSPASHISQMSQVSPASHISQMSQVSPDTHISQMSHMSSVSPTSHLSQMSAVSPTSQVSSASPTSPVSTLSPTSQMPQMSNMPSQMAQMPQFSHMSQLPQMTHLSHMPQMSSVSPPSYGHQSSNQGLPSLAHLNFPSLTDMPALRDAMLSMTGMTSSSAVPSMTTYNS